jgi:single-stranded-DNA-specific exonuclease
VNTRWIINKNIDKQVVSDLSNALSIDENLATLLVQRGITNYDEAKDFFRPSQTSPACTFRRYLQEKSGISVEW